MRYLFIALLIFELVLNAQSNSFNKTYNNDTMSILSVAGLPLQDGYLIAGDYNSISGYSSPYVRKLDLAGEQLWWQNLYMDTHHTSMFFGTSMIVTHDGHYLVTGQRGTEDTLDNFLAIKFDVLGNVIWRKEYGGLATFDSNAQVILTNDMGFLLSGWTATYNSSTGELNASQIYMVKTDNEGEQLWERKFSQHATPLYAEQTQDQGYLLSGYRYNNTTDYDMYVVKTDSIGTLEWQKTFGTDEGDGGCMVRQYSDTTYLLMGNKDNLSDGGNNLYLAMLDTEGEIIWDTTHVLAQYAGSDAAFLIEDDNSITAIVTTINPTALHLTRFSTTGDILWQSPISSGLGNESDYFRDLEPTSDGGYLLTGFNYNSPQSSWVVKVDSIGQTCGIAPCDNVAVVSATASAVRPTYPISIFPNPTTGQATIQYELPPEYPFGVLEVYDVQGQKVHAQVLPQGTGQQAVDLTGLVAGIYFYKVVTVDRVLGSGKLVVE